MNNSSNITISLEEQSLKDLDAQLIINIFLFVIALATVLSNVGVLFGLYKGGNLFRSHHYKLVIQMSAVACFQSFFTLIAQCIIRLVDTLLRIPGNMTVKNCGLMLLVMEETLVVDPYNVLVLSIDRLFAVAFPFRYKNMSIVYRVATLASPWIAGTIDTAAKFLLWTSDFIKKNVSVCLLSNTRTPEYQAYRFDRGMLVGALTVFFYLMGIVIVKYKVLMVQGNSQQLKKELGFKLMVTCATDALIYTFTFFLSQVYQTIFTVNATPQARNTFSPVALMFILLATTPRFFVNYYLNTEFKKVVKKHIFCKKQNEVESTIDRMISTNF